jgi:hypothetical protein
MLPAQPATENSLAGPVAGTQNECACSNHRTPRAHGDATGTARERRARRREDHRGEVHPSGKGSGAGSHLSDASTVGSSDGGGKWRSDSDTIFDELRGSSTTPVGRGEGGKGEAC